MEKVWALGWCPGLGRELEFQEGPGHPRTVSTGLGLWGRGGD